MVAAIGSEQVFYSPGQKEGRQISSNQVQL